MGKLLLTTTPTLAGAGVIIGNEKELHFGPMGNLIYEGDMTYRYGTLIDVEILSVLATGQGYEIYLESEQRILKKVTPLQLSDIVTEINTIPNLLQIGIRKGTIEGVNYSQYLYVYPLGTVSGTSRLFQ